MEVGFQSFSNNMQEVGASRHRSFCFQNLSGPNIWKLDPFSKRDAFQVIWTHLKGYASPPFTLTGRALNKVLKEKAILLLITPAWQTLLLKLTVRIPLLLPKLDSFISLTQRKASLGRAGKLTTPGMGSLRERLHSDRFSEDCAALITNARRSGTDAHYESVWHKCHGWCSQVYPIKCYVNKILQFLTECFNTGYKHSTISGFRSANSAYIDPINGISIGEESRISTFLTGVYIGPPQPR